MMNTPDIEHRERRVTLPMMVRQGTLAPASFDDEEGTVEVVWTTGAKVRRRNFSLFDGAEYIEELIVSKQAVRLDRLNAGAAFLNSHDDRSLDAVLGSVVPGSAKIAKGQGTATIKLSTAPADAAIVAKIKDGIIRAVSVGYAIHKVEAVEAEGEIPVVRVVDWEPMEISAVAIPADAGAGKRARDGEAKFEAVVTGELAAMSRDGKLTPAGVAQVRRDLRNRWLGESAADEADL